MNRTILETTVKDSNGKERVIYGQFTASYLLRNGLTVTKQEQHLYTMSDATFARYGERKEQKWR